MINQLSLFGNAKPRGRGPRLPKGPPGAPAWHRDVVFFALLVGEQLEGRLPAAIEPVRKRFGITTPLAPLERLHVSVMGAGYVEDMLDEDIETLQAVGPKIAFKPFDLSLTDIMSFGGRSESSVPCPLVLTCGSGAGEVLDLADRLTEGMIAQGFDPRALKPAVPHLTLLRDVARVPATPLDRPLAVTVDGFHLVHSHRGRGSYSILWP